MRMPLGALHMIGLKIRRYSGKSKEYQVIGWCTMYYTCQD